MKRTLLIVLPLLVVVGGVVGGMFYLGMPPFKKAAKKSGKTVDAKTVLSVNSQGAAGAAGSTASNAVVPNGSLPGSAVAPRRPSPKAKVTANLDTEELAQARIVRLSSVYEQMPAEEAGKIFAKLPDPLVEKLLRNMDERQVGKVLLAFDVNRAARLTQSLAK